MKKRKSLTQRYAEIINLHKTFYSNCEKSRDIFLRTAKFNSKNKLISWNETILDREVDEIMNRYPGLPDSLMASVVNYLKTGVFTLPTSVSEPLIDIKIYDNGKSTLMMQIFKNTTKKEYVNTWDKIKRLKDFKLPNGTKLMTEFNPTAISKADLIVLDLYEKGKTAGQISDYLSVHSEEIYGEDRDGEVPVESTVRSRLKTLRRHLDVYTKT